MKSNIKAFGEFLTESSDQDQELRDFGFEDRHEIQDSDELDEVVNELFFDDPEINAAWQALKERVHAQIAKFKAEYSWDSGQLADLADYYIDADRDDMTSRLNGLIAGNLMEIADEGN